MKSFPFENHPVYDAFPPFSSGTISRFFSTFPVNNTFVNGFSANDKDSYQAFMLLEMRRLNDNVYEMLSVCKQMLMVSNGRL